MMTALPSMRSVRRQCFTIAMKMDCVRAVTERAIPRSQVMEDCGISASVLSEWISDMPLFDLVPNKRTAKRVPKGLRDAVHGRPTMQVPSTAPRRLDPELQRAVRLSRCFYPVQELAVRDWVLDMRNNGDIVSSTDVRQMMLAVVRRHEERRREMGLEPEHGRFTASHHWFDGFCARHHLSSRKVSTTNITRLPERVEVRWPVHLEEMLAVQFAKSAREKERVDMEALLEERTMVNEDSKVRSFFDRLHRAVDAVRGGRNTRRLTRKVLNMDEVPVCIDMLEQRTVDVKGSPNIMARTTGNTKTRFTVMLTCRMNGKKDKPLIIFKGASGGRAEARLKKDLEDNGLANKVSVLFQKKAWVDEGVMLDHYLGERSRFAARRREGSRKEVLIMDSHRAHITDKVKARSKDLGLELTVVPGGYTPVLQPLDVGVIKPFKDALRVRWKRWMWGQGDKAGSIKEGKGPGAHRLRVAACRWVADAWGVVTAGVVRRSFAKVMRVAGEVGVVRTPARRQ